MLNRVSQALSKYISPISSSKSEVRVEPDQKQDEQKQFTRFQTRQESQGEASPQDDPQASRESKKQNLKVIKGGAPAEESVAAKEQQAPERPPSPGLSVSHAFLNLMRSIQNGRLFFAQWLGRGAYRKVQKSQKRGAHMRKGAMLDQKAE